jgi:prepilin-type N-terminal cleavage/methylation domain-containing protein
MKPGHGNLNCRHPPVHNLRAGFTLLEVLLVLAVFVIISALAVPAAHSIFSGQQLRTAADVVRARFADCRVRAIKSGDVYAFFYKPNSGEYWVAPVTSGFRTLASGVTPSQQHLLENEITFIAGETQQDGRSKAETENVAAAFNSFRPILFYADGTTQDAVVILQTKRGLQIKLELRGLTGVAAKSRILSEQDGK